MRRRQGSRRPNAFRFACFTFSFRVLHSASFLFAQHPRILMRLSKSVPTTSPDSKTSPRICCSPRLPFRNSRRYAKHFQILLSAIFLFWVDIISARTPQALPVRLRVHLGEIVRKQTGLCWSVNELGRKGGKCFEVFESLEALARRALSGRNA